MNLSWSWWCKHFHLVCLFFSIHFLSSVDSITAGDDPTEEPQENSHSTTTIPTSSPFPAIVINSDSSSKASNEFINETKAPAMQERIKFLPSDSDIPKADTHPPPNVNENERQDQHEARAFFPSSGNLFSWKTAGWMLKKGLRLFRESVVEGAKVAHMFKEDVDEGMSSIMRQNRGVKVDSQGAPAHQNENSGSSSIFDSQLLREGVLGGILRFMGINSKQMGVIALNVLIILAEWITSSMIGNNEYAGATSRMIKSNLLQWANTGQNLQVEKILTQAKSHTLPEKLIDSLSAKTGNTTSCVQLLICKMSPVIWGFQDTVKDQMHSFGWFEETGWKTASTTAPPFMHNNSSTFDEDKGDNLFSEPRGILETSQYLVDKFLGYLPETERMIDFGDRCEAKFPQCHLLKFGTGK